MKTTSTLALIATILCLAVSPAATFALDSVGDHDGSQIMELTPTETGRSVDAFGIASKDQHGRTTLVGVKVEANLKDGSILILEAKTEQGWVDLGAFKLLFGGGSLQIGNPTPMDLSNLQTIAVTYRGEILLVGSFR